MAVEYKDSKGQDIEPGDTVKITFEVTVESVVSTREGSNLTYADQQQGQVTVACDQVEKTASRV